MVGAGEERIVDVGFHPMGEREGVGYHCPMTTIDSLDRFLEVQLAESGCQNGESHTGRVAPVIAISREAGCDGESIAKTLASELDLDLYDWEILEQIASDAQVSGQVVATLAEKFRPRLDEWLAGFPGGSGLSAYHYMQCLRRVLFTVAARGNAVILGRGANFLLPLEKRTLGLFLVAPLEARARTVMEKLGLSRESALRHIAGKDREQRLWVKKVGHVDINEAAQYHLVINTALVTPETIVRIVKEMLAV